VLFAAQTSPAVSLTMQGGLQSRVSSKQSILFSVQTETQSVLVVFWFVSRNQFISVCFGVSDQYQNNRNKQNFFKSNRKQTKKFSKKALYQTVAGQVNSFKKEEKDNTPYTVTQKMYFIFCEGIQLANLHQNLR
jgi:hypothetical protein